VLGCRWLQGLLFTVLVFSTGCGSDRSRADFISTSTSSNSLVVLQHTLQRSVGSDVVALRAAVRDVRGELVAPTQTYPSTSRIEFFVPSSSAVLEIDYLGQGDAVRGTFATTLDPTQNPVTVVDDPAWVESESLDPTIFRFAITGCNRLGFGELSDDNPSSANRAQLTADLTAIPDLFPPVSHFFFAGDLVTNLEPGSDTLSSQLNAWLEIFEASPLAGSSVQLVPFTGNHEVLFSQKDPSTGEFVEFPNPATLPVWTTIMASYIRGADGPTASLPNPDGLTEDESQLSYTFQTGDVLFVILNTDTIIDTVTLGDVPLNWLQARLDMGQNDPTVNHIFVMGHKPIVSPEGADELPGPGSIRSEEKVAFADLLATHAKVRGYLCAHAHLWDYSNLDLGTPQVIAGNAGSEIEPPFNDTGRGYYGYTLVSLHTSGLTHLESWGRPVPNPYNSDSIQPNATLRVKRLLR
jgi:hypothetical protein